MLSPWSQNRHLLHCTFCNRPIYKDPSSTPFYCQYTLSQVGQWFPKPEYVSYSPKLQSLTGSSLAPIIVLKNLDQYDPPPPVLATVNSRPSPHKESAGVAEFGFGSDSKILLTQIRIRYLDLKIVFFFINVSYIFNET